MGGETRGLVHGVRLSSVVPGRVTGEGRVRELGAADLAAKLHYLRAVYFFDKEAVEGLTMADLKRPMFGWLVHCFAVCGRIREGGEGGRRPYIRLNDGGVRIVEAECSERSVEEWLGMEECCSLSEEMLVYRHVLGPDLLFTPLVFLQFTWFKCGGMSVGLSWAHVLGDPFSATAFMSLLGQFMRPNPPSKPLSLPDPQTLDPDSTPTRKPLCLRRVNPVGSHWVAPPTSVEMLSHTFHLYAKDLDRLRSSIHGKYDGIRTFDLISAAIWKCLAVTRREKSEPTVVTICRFRPRDGWIHSPCNGGEICSVEADSIAPSEADLADLATLLADRAADEGAAVRATVERERDESDFIVYGANLTFVDVEETDLYGFAIQGMKAVFANLTVGGVGENGVVLVLPAPEKGGGRVITVILPASEIQELKKELKESILNNYTSHVPRAP